MKKNKMYFEEEFKPPEQYFQLELIPLTDIECLGFAVKEYKQSADKVRRGVYAKVTDLAKKVTELTCQVESLQHQIVVMNQWMITQLGLAGNALSMQGQPLTTEFQHITNLNVTSAEKSSPSQDLEIMDGQSLSA